MRRVVDHYVILVPRKPARERQRALTRASATLVSFVLCLIYLLIFAFHPLELVVLIGLAAFLLSLAGRPQDVVTAAVTVVIVAAISPHDAWEQPILRAIDTGVGIAVGLAASSIALRLTQAHHRRR